MSDNKLIPFQRQGDMANYINDTVTRINSIFERLQHYDQLLYSKLEDFNIEPTVYGM
jgi:Mg2+ and Co2+ transporter CorA